MIYQKNMFVRYRVIDSKSYIIKKNDAFILDDVGREIWELVNGQNSNEDIIQTIALNFSEDVDHIKGDIEKYLKELLKDGLIESISY